MPGEVMLPVINKLPPLSSDVIGNDKQRKTLKVTNGSSKPPFLPTAINTFPGFILSMMAAPTDGLFVKNRIN